MFALQMFCGRTTNTTLNKCYSVQQDTEPLLQQQGILTSQIADLNSRLTTGRNLDEEYKLLKANKKAALVLNKDLESQVKRLRSQLQAQIALEEKHKAGEEEKERLQEKNTSLKLQVEELQKKLKDKKVLEEEHKLAKKENKALTQQNSALEKTAKDLKLKISIQETLEEKIELVQGLNTALDRNIFEAEQEVKELTAKLAEERTMKHQYSRLKAEKKEKSKLNYDLHCRVMDLREQYEIAKPRLQRYYDLKDLTVSLQAEKESLMKQFQDLLNQLRRQGDLGRAYNETMSVKETMKQDISVLRFKIQELRKELQGSEGPEGRPQADPADRPSIVSNNCPGQKNSKAEDLIINKKSPKNPTPISDPATPTPISDPATTTRSLILQLPPLIPDPPAPTPDIYIYNK
ncbi:Hypothetical predicted protein [Xyrichtys novacula]|uniref:Uncharacterized protein n=1 Tax=Xyrichtys novacula TaxID=13765 RepID=A0AAV1F0R4_XYRNO|nr:Hypothetical predicted protein [Xyrichtys novacula]